MKTALLSAQHYASQWDTDFRPVAETNRLGVDYANMPDGPAKEAKLVTILQSFHGYLMKYLSMICVGHVAMWAGRVNKDTKTFLKYLIPKDTPINSVTMGATCRTLHLAFKGMEADEVYNILTELLIAAVRKYDPNYTDKVRLITEIIDEELRKHAQFNAADIDQHLDFDSAGYLRLLQRHGFLLSHGAKASETVRYSRSSTWPPPASFFNKGPIGFAYYLQTWFRYYLQQWIEGKMGELESQEGVYSLDYSRSFMQGDAVVDSRDMEVNIPHADGEFTTVHGMSYAVDVSLGDAPLDVSKMTLDWVRETSDPLFADLSRRERYLLFQVFVRDTPFPLIAESLGTSTKALKEDYSALLARLKQQISDHQDAAARRREGLTL